MEFRLFFIVLSLEKCKLTADSVAIWWCPFFCVPLLFYHVIIVDSCPKTSLDLTKRQSVNSDLHVVV